MNTHHWNERLSPLEDAARVDAAKAQALVLRTEAIDALWGQLAASFRNAWRALRRNPSKPPVHATQETAACPR